MRVFVRCEVKGVGRREARGRCVRGAQGKDRECGDFRGLLGRYGGGWALRNAGERESGKLGGKECGNGLPSGLGHGASGVVHGALPMGEDRWVWPGGQ